MDLFERNGRVMPKCEKSVKAQLPVNEGIKEGGRLHATWAVASEVPWNAAGACRHAVDPVGDVAIPVSGNLDFGGC